MHMKRIGKPDVTSQMRIYCQAVTASSGRRRLAVGQPPCPFRFWLVLSFDCFGIVCSGLAGKLQHLRGPGLCGVVLCFLLADSHGARHSTLPCGSHVAACPATFPEKGLLCA